MYQRARARPRRASIYHSSTWTIPRRLLVLGAGEPLDDNRRRFSNLSFSSLRDVHRYKRLQVELGRKLVLNGFIVLCNQGSVLQLAIALMVVVIHLISLIHIRPMLKPSNNVRHEC